MTTQMKSKKKFAVFLNNFQLKQSHQSRDGIIFYRPQLLLHDFREVILAIVGYLNHSQRYSVENTFFWPHYHNNILFYFFHFQSFSLDESTTRQVLLIKLRPSMADILSLFPLNNSLHFYNLGTFLQFQFASDRQRSHL